jgi:hypothetical protein
MTYIWLKYVAAQLGKQTLCLIKIVVLRRRENLPIQSAITLEAFLDIEEAFGSTSFDIII